jgi:hypothetical protein
MGCAIDLLVTAAITEAHRLQVAGQILRLFPGLEQASLYEPSDWFGLMSNAVWTTTWELPGTIGKFEPQFCNSKV